MKIGLPAALLHHFYGVFWQQLFTELGCEVVESPQTSKALLNKATKVTVPDLCLPIKIYVGHVLQLLEDKVDYIYVPRMISIRDGDTFCPKFLGLPDLLKYSLPGMEDKILSHHVTSSTEDISDENNYRGLQEQLGVTTVKLKSALQKAGERWSSFRNLCFKGYNCFEAAELAHDSALPAKSKGQVHIGLLGYVYNIYDNFVSQNVIEKLEKLGASYIAFEMLDQPAIEKELTRFRKALFWTFSNKLLAAAYNFFEDPGVDGVIHVTAFGCGPDSFMGKIMQIDATDRYNKPFMTLRVDEHTGDSHLDTRLEAFVDMLIRKKMKQGVPA